MVDPESVPAGPKYTKLLLRHSKVETPLEELVQDSLEAGCSGQAVYEDG